MWRCNEYARLRRAPTTAAADVIGVIQRGDVVPGELMPGNPLWLRVRLGVVGGTLPVLQSAIAPFSPYGYALASLFSEITPPPPPPPPPPAGKARVGVSVLGNHHLLEPAYNAGIRDFLIMDGVQAAREFKARHPDAWVMLRRFMPHGLYLPDVNGGDMRELQTVGAGICVVCPANEGDIWPQGAGGGMSLQEVIAKRADFDRRMAIECRRHGTLYAAGGFSMGEPDYTNPALCDAMAAHYAPSYNAGLFGINCHLYSPNPSNIDGAATIWHENRWRFLFTHCGFQNVPNPVGIVADECGLDEGGIGGVPAHGLGGEYVEKWTRKALQIWAEPVAGAASPMRSAVWFQAGGNGDERWAGYDVQAWLGSIAAGNR